MSMRFSRSVFALMGALVGAMSFVVLVPSTAFACSCAQDSVAGHVERADLVVAGVVEDRDEGPFKAIQSSGDPVTYTVAVDEVLKGETGPVTKVVSAADGASCGLEIEVGRSYVIFAEAGGKDGAYQANLCGGTSAARTGFVAEVEAITGPATAPDDSILPPNGGPPVAAIALGGLLLAGAAVVAAVVLRRRRHS